jgi:hypothetical protein
MLGMSKQQLNGYISIEKLKKIYIEILYLTLVVRNESFEKRIKEEHVKKFKKEHLKKK